MPRTMDSRQNDERVAELEEMVAGLEGKLEQSERQSEQLADRLIEMQSGAGGPAGTIPLGAFPLIMAVIIAGRMVIYAYVEHRGSFGKDWSLGLTVLFGGLALTVFGKWLDEGWKQLQWRMIPKIVIVLVAFLVSLSVFSDGHVWEGVMETPKGMPWAATALIMAALALAASRACERGLVAILNFLDNPRMRRGAK